MKLHSLIAAALLAATGASHAGLIHQYELNGNLNDAKNGAPLIALGGSLGASGYAFTENKGLALQYALGSVYTIDLVFKLARNDLNYQRLLNFQYATAPDDGMYVSTDHFCFYRGTCLNGASFAPQQNIRLTLTRDANSLVTAYYNGAEMFSFDDSSGIGQANLTGDRKLSFFKDNGAGEYATGSVDFIHLYDNALTKQEVAALGSVDMPEPASVGLLGAGLALLGWTRRRRQGAA